MKTAEHTQGPWHLVISETYKYQIDVIPEGECSPICVVYGSIDDGENGANARLIAAAPDLLEALGHVIGYFDGWRGDYINQAYAALSKANGGELLDEWITEEKIDEGSEIRKRLVRDECYLKVLGERFIMGEVSIEEALFMAHRCGKSGNTNILE